MSLPPLVEPGPVPHDLARYSRQLVLPQLGVPGQQRLAAAKVLVIGAGGLGSPALLYLAAAGVGTLGVVDDDVVETSNLHRQVVHGTASVGRAKVDSAAAAVAALNLDVVVVRHRLRLDERNATALVRGYDLVLDGSDNFPTRYLVDDACAAAGVPLVWGCVLGFAAQVAVFWDAAPGGGMRLRDVFPAPPAPGEVPSCEEAGVVGAVCGQAGTVMATEAVKLITGIGEPLLGRLLVMDLLRARWDVLPVRRAAAARDRAPSAPDEAPTSGPDEAVPEQRGHVSATALAAALAGPEPARPFLLDVRTPDEYAAGHLAGSVNLPLPQLLAGQSVPAEGRDIVVICRTGARASVAAGTLTGRGALRVRVLAGGLAAWPGAVVG